jgi:hypothetical protein
MEVLGRILRLNFGSELNKMTKVTQTGFIGRSGHQVIFNLWFSDDPMTRFKSAANQQFASKFLQSASKRLMIFVL